MANITKSKYNTFLKNEKDLWLSAFKPELKEQKSVFTQISLSSSDVISTAIKLFPKIVSVEEYGSNNYLNIKKTIENTKLKLKKKTKYIKGATFSTHNATATADVLKRHFGGSYSLYEIKSSTSEKQNFYIDIAFKKHVIEQCGLKIKNVFLIYLNKNYVKSGDINEKLLFNVVNVTQKIEDYEKQVASNIEKAEKVLNSDVEPVFKISKDFNSLRNSPFYNYHTKHMPTPNIFDIYALPGAKKVELFKKGIFSFEDVLKNKVPLNSFQSRQVDFYINNKEHYIDKEGVKSFIKTLVFPLYFVDFESYETAVPIYDGTKPNQKMLFQFSLHVVKDKVKKDFEHYEYLASPNVDPRREFALKLLQNIKPDGGTIVVYNKDFETARIAELANEFEDLKSELLNLITRVVDLQEVFDKGLVYHKDMGGSFSIKSILPALYPNEEKLNYSNLNTVHDGTDAQIAFFSLKTASESEAVTIKQNLLEYCKLDTLAMVYIYFWLIENS